MAKLLNILATDFYMNGVNHVERYRFCLIYLKAAAAILVMIQCVYPICGVSFLAPNIRRLAAAGYLV